MFCLFKLSNRKIESNGEADDHGGGTRIAKGILRYCEVCIHSGGMEGFLTTILQKKAMASD